MIKYLFFFAFPMILFSQKESNTHEYLGFLKLPDSTYISYKVNFSENNGFIKGHSYTDLNGAHETKSTIVGQYNNRKNTIEFREVEIIYTKSDVTRFDFCYVYFSGKTRKLNDKATIEGKFKGFYNDLTKCIDGELDLNAYTQIKKRADNFQKKVQGTSRIPDSLKQRVNANKFVNRFENNVLKGGDKINMIWSKQSLKLKVSDPGSVDTDKIRILLNGKTILDDFTLTKTERIIDFKLTDAVNTITIKALNEGSEPRNTAKLEVLGGIDDVVNLMTSLKTGEEIKIVLYKEKPVVSRK